MSMENKLRIVIADDHPMLVEGVRAVIQEIPGMEVVRSVSNGRELIAALSLVQADLVLVDLNMPKMDGPEAIRVIRRMFGEIKVIVFTSYSRPEFVKEAKKLGTEGYLLKSASSSEIKEAIVTVARGGTWFGPFAAGPAEETDVGKVDDFVKKYQITPREVEILTYIAEGLTSRQIAGKLFVSEFTINAHRRNICRKLEIYTSVGLLNFARGHGLIGKT